MQPLNPPKNDCVSRARASSRKLVEAPESGLSAKSGSSHHSNSTDEGRENRRRSLKSANPRRSGMLGRAKSMRQARSSVTRKERSASFDLGDDNDRDHNPDELHDNNSKHSNNSSSKDKHRRSSKSSKDLLSSKSNHSSASSSTSKRKKSFKKHDPLSSQSSHAAFHRHDYDDDGDNHESNVLSSQTSQEPVNRGGRPIMARRASLSNIKATFGSKSKRFLGSSSNSNSKQHDNKEQQNARPALTSQYSVRIMSKPVATGPYEGIALIECDVTVHGGADLAAKNRQFHLGKRASSNPFVEVWQNLPSQMVGKTKTVTKTLQPTYDESFKITWTEKALSRCLSKSHQAKIMLKIWDADRISGAEAMGEVSILVPLPNDCPTVSRQWFLVDKDSARNASGRLLVSLNVRHVRTKEEEEEEFESDNESF